jgi:hypothetical protein
MAVSEATCLEDAAGTSRPNPFANPQKIYHIFMPLFLTDFFEKL